MQSSERLKNKVALIVGGGQMAGQTIGNGRATAIKFANEGAKILIADINIKSANETVKLINDNGGSASAIQGDISDSRDCKRFVSNVLKKYNQLDILQNNVGIGPGKSGPNNISIKEWRKMIDINLTGMFLIIKNVLPVMQEMKSGVITNISSTISIAGNSKVRGSIKNKNAEGQTAYTVSKAGVNTLTKSFALSQAIYGIRVNAILPGLIHTPNGIESAIKSTKLSRKKINLLRNEQVPLCSQQGSAWDIANASLFLASDDAKYITGILLPVDGGLSLKRG